MTTTDEKNPALWSQKDHGLSLRATADIAGINKELVQQILHEH